MDVYHTAFLKCIADGITMFLSVYLILFKDEVHKGNSMTNANSFIAFLINCDCLNPLFWIMRVVY